MKQIRISLMLFIALSTAMFSCNDNDNAVTPNNHLVQDVTYSDIVIARFNYDSDNRPSDMSIDKDFLKLDEAKGEDYLDFNMTYIGSTNELKSITSSSNKIIQDSISIEYKDNSIEGLIYKPANDGALAYSGKIVLNKNVNGSINEKIVFLLENGIESAISATSYAYAGGNILRQESTSLNSGVSEVLTKEYSFNRNNNPFKRFNLIGYFFPSTVLTSVMPVQTSVIAETGKAIQRTAYTYIYDSGKYWTSGELTRTSDDKPDESTIIKFSLSYK